MLHHVSVGSKDIQRAKAFYDPVLSTVGLRLVADRRTSLDYGAATIEFSVETPTDDRPASAGNGVHTAFAVGSRAMVDQFHAAGLSHGGTDAGAPGIRTNYDAHYYAAFVRDPDGNKIEAVIFAAE